MNNDDKEEKSQMTVKITVEGVDVNLEIEKSEKVKYASIAMLITELEYVKAKLMSWCYSEAGKGDGEVMVR